MCIHAHVLPPETLPLLHPSTKQSAARGLALAYVHMGLSAVFQAGAALSTRLAETGYGVPPSNGLLTIGLVVLTIPLFQLARAGRLQAALAVPSDLVVPLAARALCGGCAALASLVSVAHVSAGLFSVLFGLAPIFTSFLAAPLCGQPLTIRHAVSLVINLLGVALVSYTPSGAAPAPVSTSGPAPPGGHFVFGFLAGLAAALCASGSALSVNRLGRRVDTHVVTAAFGLGCVLVTPLAARPGDFARLPGPSDARAAAVVVAGAASVLLTQRFFALSLERAPPGPAVLVRSLAVPLVALAAFPLMGEAVGWLGALGVFLTVASLAPLVLADERGDGC